MDDGPTVTKSTNIKTLIPVSDPVSAKLSTIPLTYQYLHCRSNIDLCLTIHRTRR